MLVALIPARGGSERIKDKNIQLLGGIPLIAWTILAARKSALFDMILVSTDSNKIGEISEQYNAGWIDRPEKYATASSPDIEWIRHAINCLPDLPDPTSFVLLRPTNPFRTAETINRAWKHWLTHQPADSLRSVRPVNETPFKMWKMQQYPDVSMIPLMCDWTGLYDKPTQELPSLWIQNGCIQIFTMETFKVRGDHTGRRVIPFIDNSLDLNTLEDWLEAEDLIQQYKIVPEEIVDERRLAV